MREMTEDQEMIVEMNEEEKEQKEKEWINEDKKGDQKEDKKVVMNEEREDNSADMKGITAAHQAMNNVGEDDDST